MGPSQVSGLDRLAQRPTQSHISTFADDKDFKNIKIKQREAASLPQF